MKRIIFSICLILFISQNIFAQAPPLQRGIRGKHKGGIIALRTDAEVVAWCDFNKTIVVTAYSIICVYNGSGSSGTS